jgi:hypothetical protein
MPRRTGRIGDVSLFKPRKIRDLAVAAITGFVLLNLTRCHFMSELKKGPSTGTDGSNPAPSRGESGANSGRGRAGRKRVRQYEPRGNLRRILSGGVARHFFDVRMLL